MFIMQQTVCMHKLPHLTLRGILTTMNSNNSLLHIGTVRSRESLPGFLRKGYGIQMCAILYKVTALDRKVAIALNPTATNFCLYCLN